MKKKIYKVLGIVLTMAIVLSACLCAVTVAHAEGETVVPTLAQGTIDKGKILTSSLTRLHTPDAYSVAEFESVTVAEGYKVYFQFYNADGLCIATSKGWKTGTVKLASCGLIPGVTDFRLSFGSTDDSLGSLTPADAPENAVVFTKGAGTTLPAYTEDVVVDGVLTPGLASGTVNGSHLAEAVATHGVRLYPVTVFKIADIDEITVAAGCRVYVQYFKADGSYNAGSGWQYEGTYKAAGLTGASGATYFRITFDSADGTTTPPTDGLKLKLVVKQEEPEEEPKDVVNGTTLYPVLGAGKSVDGKAGLTLDTCLVTNSNRRYTVNAYECSYVKSITFDKAHCRIYVQYFDADGNWVAGSGWQTEGTYKIDSTKAQFKVTVSCVEGGNDAKLPNADALTFTVVPKDVVDGTTVTPAMITGSCNGVNLDNSNLINSTDGNNGKRLATYNVYQVADVESLTVAADCRVFVQFFNEDGTYNSGNGWITEAGTYKIASMKPVTNGATQFKVTLSSTKGGNDAEVPPADGLTFKLHAYGEYVAKDAATCTSNATEEAACECGATVTREIADTKLDHTYENYTYNEDATCTANGTETGKCECGAEDVREAADTKLDHTYENYTYNEDATCTANGTETGKCECGEEDIIEAADTKLDHFYNTEYDIDCNTCGEVREAPEKAENSEVKDGLLYIDGQTSIRGMFKVGEDYYFADWGGVIKTGKIYVKSSYCDLPAGKEYTFGEDGKLLNGIVDGVLYIDGITASKGIYEIDGDYYFADWGGVIKTDGKYYTGYIYAEGLTAGEYAFGADGKMLDGIVEKDGAQYIYVKGVTVAPGEYEVDGVLYKATWGGLVVAE